MNFYIYNAINSIESAKLIIKTYLALRAICLRVKDELNKKAKSSEIHRFQKV